MPPINTSLVCISNWIYTVMLVFVCDKKNDDENNFIKICVLSCKYLERLSRILFQYHNTNEQKLETARNSFHSLIQAETSMILEARRKLQSYHNWISALSVGGHCTSGFLGVTCITCRLHGERPQGELTTWSSCVRQKWMAHYPLKPASDLSDPLDLVFPMDYVFWLPSHSRWQLTDVLDFIRTLLLISIH